MLSAADDHRLQPAATKPSRPSVCSVSGPSIAMCALTPLNRRRRGQGRTCRVWGRSSHADVPRSSRPCLFACRPAWWKPDAPLLLLWHRGAERGGGGESREVLSGSRGRRGGSLHADRQTPARPATAAPLAHSVPNAARTVFWHAPAVHGRERARAPPPPLASALPRPRPRPSPQPPARANALFLSHSFF